MMRYVIENGEAYQIREDKGYKVSFNLNREMNVDEEDSIDIKGKPTYSLYEIERKLNVDYNIAQEKAKLLKEAELKELLKNMPKEEKEPKQDEENKKLNDKEKK